MKAMILAAGLGTRLKPFTDNHPKALAVVNHKTILQRNIEYLKSYGINDFIINVHHFADQIQSFIQQYPKDGIRIQISDESSEVLETGGGLKKAAWFFNDNQPFVLMNVDILTDLPLDQMLAFHAQHKPLATLAVSQRNSSRCFLFNKNQELCGWRNKNTEEEKISRKEFPLYEFAFSGLHMIDPRIFTQINKEGKFSMVDVYLELSLKHPIKAFDHSGAKFIDVGKPESIIQAEKIFE
ncbi:MAG: nucleotidyltransferase family protein [Chitinophagaceae bacterium]|nr:nucleotidyltransferase family protein [Chitinophagaceae bacterium]